MDGRRVTTGLSLAAALLFTAGQVAARCADFVPGPKPQNVNRDLVGHDLDTIIDRGTISFAVYEDFAPYSYLDGEEPKGIDIEVGRIIAADIGVEPVFNFVGAGETLEADLRNHVWRGTLVGRDVSNVMLHVPYDSEFSCRVEQVVFTGQYFEEAIAIAYRHDAYPEDPPLPAYFRFDTVAVENDSIADFYLSSLAGGQLLNQIRRYPDVEAAMSALETGEVMAAMGPRGQLEAGLTEATGIHEPPLPGFAVGRWTLGVAIRHNYRALAYTVDDAIRYAIEDGRMAEIFARHGLTFAPPER